MPIIFRLPGASDARIKLITALLIVYIVWGTTYNALNLAMQSMPPLLMNGTRFVAAGAIMLAIARWQRLPWPTGAQWRHSALIGGLMVCGAMGMVVMAQKMGIGSGLMATVVTTMPMWLALWTRWGGEAVPVTSWIGLALGVAGAAVLALEGDFSATWLGALLAFGAPLLWSIGSYASRKLDLPAPGHGLGVRNGSSAACHWSGGGMCCSSPATRTWQIGPDQRRLRGWPGSTWWSWARWSRSTPTCGC
jgi:drug/metabolite transporter (DMT)-like permease